MSCCRSGTCEINNNLSKKTKAVKPTTRCSCTDSCADLSDFSSEDSFSSCSTCGDSPSSSCSCSDCNADTESSEEDASRRQKQRKKQKNNNKVLRCRDGVYEWLTKKKLKKETKLNKVENKKSLGKKARISRKCPDCC